MNKNSNKWILLFVCCFVGADLFAQGFRTPPASSVGVGMAGAKYTLMDDLSAVSVNPSNIEGLSEPTLEAVINFGYLNKEFTSSQLGVKAESSDPWAIIPGVYYGAPGKDGDSLFALGVTVPYGRSVKYDDDAFFSFSSATFGELGVVDINPTYVRQLNEKVSFSVGFDFYWSYLELRQRYPWSMTPFGTPNSPAGKALFEAEGVGIGGGVSATIKLTEKQKIGLAYKSPFDIDYDGDFEVSNVPSAAAQVGVSSISDYDTKIRYPTIIGLGYSIEMLSDLKLGFDLEWAEHSRFQELPVDIGSNSPLLPSNTLAQNWKDTWQAGAGFEYTVSETLTLRGGYLFLEAPSPSSTLIPIAAESDFSVITVGLGYLLGEDVINLGYSYAFFSDNKVNDNQDPLLNGEYETDSQTISISYTHKI